MRHLKLLGLILLQAEQWGGHGAEVGRSRGQRGFQKLARGMTGELPCSHWHWGPKCPAASSNQLKLTLVQLIISHPDCAYHVALREIQCTNKVKTWWPGEGFRAMIKSASKVKVDEGTVLAQRPK